MALSLIVYAGQNLLPPPFVPPFTTYVQKQAQSADAEDMTLKVQQALDEIEQLNADITAAYAAIVPIPSTPLDQLLLSYADSNLAGGGDGHTFVFTLTFTITALNLIAALLAPLPPEALNFQFCLAGEEDALAIAFRDMTERFAIAGGDPQSPVGLALWQQVAGAAKGTRFMGGVGGVVQNANPPGARAASAPAAASGAKPSIASLLAARDALTGGLFKNKPE